MRTGSGNRSYYNRTTGSRTARLYSKRTAKRINKIYQSSQAQRIRNINIDNMPDDAESYDDYFDDPVFIRTRKKEKNKNAIILAISLASAIIIIIIAGLIFLKPSDTARLAAEPSQTMSVQEAERTATEQETTVPAAVQVPTSSEVTAVEDSNPPVIYGVMPIVVYAGHSVSYKQGIHITDDNDPNPVLQVYNDDVDLSTPGTYIVTYIARDSSGNTTRVPTTVSVLAGQNIVSDEDIYALADSVLDVIITDQENTPELKCLKVYEYLHAIGYVDEVHSEDWMQNAYWMLQKREGDCFCYYSAARLLLTRLGFDVMEVRNNNNYVHFWCLVSIDGGKTWWHFDPTCWSWGEDGVLCLVSDNYLDEFTHRHKTSDGRLIHSWDRNNYPATPEYDFWTDEDRAVIYEGGLIQLESEYDMDQEIWDDNDGWDDYPVAYEFDENAYEYYETPEDTMPYTDPEGNEYVSSEYSEEYVEEETEYVEEYYTGELIYDAEIPEEYPAGPGPAAGGW